MLCEWRLIDSICLTWAYSSENWETITIEGGGGEKYEFWGFGAQSLQIVRNSSTSWMTCIRPRVLGECDESRVQEVYTSSGLDKMASLQLGIELDVAGPVPNPAYISRIAQIEPFQNYKPVSYTHLTLPTIYSV